MLKKRSKTCILIKNLPANTDSEELKALFVRFGHIARFLMPKHGISALVDFVEPFEAKKAFTKLAYSQFKTAPLYLEWAPENVFIKSVEKTESDNSQSVSVKEDEPKAEENVSSQKPKTTIESETISKIEQESKDESIDNEDPENDTVIFVKNLNFKTTEDMVKEVCKKKPDFFVILNEKKHICKTITKTFITAFFELWQIIQCDNC